MRNWKLLVLVVFVTALFPLVAPFRGADAATTRVWTGAVNVNWNTAGNWSPAGVPVDGDSVLIGSAALGKTLNNDRPAGLTLASLAFTDEARITGNQVGISNSIQVGAADISGILDLPIVLKADSQAIVATGSILFFRPQLTPVGTPGLDLAGHKLTKAGPGLIEFHGDLSGGGGVDIQTGSVIFRAPVTFGGTIALAPNTSVLLGNLSPGIGFCGSAPNTTFTMTNALLAASCVVSIKSVSGTGELALFNPDTRLFIAGAGSGANFSGKITGYPASTIICCSNGGQTFSGTSPFNGNVFVNSGALYLEGGSFPDAANFTVQGGQGFRANLVGYGFFGQTILTTADLDLRAINGKFGFARFPNLQFAPDVLVDYEFKGGVAGTGFTQILMNGQIVLDSAVLRLEFGSYTPPVGQSLALIRGATALLDTFRNYDGGGELTEGSTFTVPGPLTDGGNVSLKFSITYKGGAGGHDVIITRLASSSQPVLTFRRILPMVRRD